ncbi:hypothetical protein KM176_05710 [Pseudooceanicola sp. CBS1P-1]|uniref:Transposase n=1 Tax=Pseudooceanicola albus TaxID=2692189 RepID=A0A6L7FYJ1_9RHOB|nr:MULTISPECIES: hypothetical protein [Pseudooceanicola]MBT9383349.1 hypothetical protein [Pseudooceanicola endophyticus]MXN16328.1 hypothetical protein [Pseudooceanicola albus]
MFASQQDPTLKACANHLRKDGKSRKVIVTAVARKLAIITNGLCKRREEWAPRHP